MKTQNPELEKLLEDCFPNPDVRGRAESILRLAMAVLVSGQSLVPGIRTKKNFKAFVRGLYDTFEKQGYTNSQVVRCVEQTMFDLNCMLQVMRAMRGDVSTNMGSHVPKFDRKVHTHRFGNGYAPFRAGKTGGKLVGGRKKFASLLDQS